MSALPRGGEEGRKSNDGHQEAMPVAGLGSKIEGQFWKIKEHAETYPYVWGSYILVYGGLGLWLTYRWRKLRKTEDRIQLLQERLRKLVEVEQPPKSATVAVTVTEQSTQHASLANKMHLSDGKAET